MKNFEDTLVGRPNTVKTQKSLFNNWIKPHLPKNDDELDVLFASKLAAKWAANELKPGTIRVLTNILNKYYKFKGTDLGGYKPLSKSTFPILKKAWSKQETAKALKTAESTDPELYKLMLLALHTGLRKGEIFGLKWKDIDFMKGQIYVSCSYDGPTKTGKPRVVPMSKKVEELLMFDYTVDKNDEHCFARWEPGIRLRKICELSGVPYITFHGLRHTFATLALDSGRSPKLVSTVLGHSKLSTTLDLYWQYSGEQINLDFLP